MRLSDAILLGSTVVTPKAGALRFSNENAGCALGMAVIAGGGGFRRVRRIVPATERRTSNIEDLWGSWLLRVVARPCDCRVPVIQRAPQLQENNAQSQPQADAWPHAMRIRDLIAHLFDFHVMEKRDWSLERLVAWLQPLEPTGPDEIAFLNREAVPQRDLSAEAAQWQETREAFEARSKAKPRRFARNP